MTVGVIAAAGGLVARKRVASRPTHHIRSLAASAVDPGAFLQARGKQADGTGDDECADYLAGVRFRVRTYTPPSARSPVPNSVREAGSGVETKL